MPLTDLSKLITSLSAFDFGAEQEKIIYTHRDAIADFQAQQWAKGIASTGAEINPPYRPYTIEQKKGKPGLAGVTSRITFYDTGELYSLLRATVESGQYTITGATFKFQAIQERSGKRVVGLTPDSKKEFAYEITLPGMKKVLKEKTGLVIT